MSKNTATKRTVTKSTPLRERLRELTEAAKTATAADVARADATAVARSEELAKAIPDICEMAARGAASEAVVEKFAYYSGSEKKDCDPKKLTGHSALLYEKCEAMSLCPTVDYWWDGGQLDGYCITVHW